MATERRKKTQGGQEIFEFALIVLLLVPAFLGAFIVGMNLIRSIQCNQMCRDLTDMYIHGADFSTYSMQTMAQREQPPSPTAWRWAPEIAPMRIVLSSRSKSYSVTEPWSVPVRKASVRRRVRR
jgi:hypothetical protein